MKTPSELRETDKTTLTWDQLRAALARLSFWGLDPTQARHVECASPGELFGLRWKRLDPDRCLIDIKETIYKGKIRSWGKTKGSLTQVAIAKQLAAELVEWRRQCLDPSPEAFMFANAKGEFMDSSNYRKRVLHKLAKDLGLPKLTFQVIRRTIATLAKDKGHGKDIQGMMRHSRVATTTDVYRQSLEEGVRSTVDSIHQELTGTFGPVPEPMMVDGLGPNTGRGGNVSVAVPGKDSAFTPAHADATDGEKTMKKPVRGVVLEFATRMRQSRGREVLLNDWWT